MDKAVLWDMDGTLVDSLGHHWIAWRDQAEAEGFALSYQTFLSTLGRRNEELMIEWFGDRVSEAERRRIADDKEARYRELVKTKGIDPLPGVMDWLARLRQAGWKQAVATAAPGPNEAAVVETLDLASWFDARITADHVTRGKPFPDIFLAAAAAVSVPASRAIVVEDAPAGVEAARAAGMKVIAVCANAIPDADIWVRSLTDLPLDAFDGLLR